MKENEICYGCLFCKTGVENRLAELLMERNPSLKALAPVKKRIRRTHGVGKEETVVLFPGYVFFCADSEFPAERLTKLDGVYRLLTADANDWRLRGRDRRLLTTFFENNGVIELSRAYYEGDRIRIAEGFMKDYEGQILRVNRRSRTAQIRMDFGGLQTTVWLGFELIADEKRDGEAAPDSVREQKEPRIREYAGMESERDSYS